ncbi:MAG: major facilitator superfamily transporter [Candidatus Acidoferrum typicum]|nr:major facilitator superfamily transporter [Candidatus Acidoferrum typicum]
MADLIPTAEEVQPTSSPAPSSPGPSQLPAAFRSLKHRNFRLFFSGQLISLIGTWMQTIAEAWLIYRLTGSSVLLGLLGFVSQIPIFLLSPIAGLAADRWPRQRVVIATQLSSMTLGFTLAALTLSGRIRVWEIISLATLLGVVNAFDVPARQSFLIEMVGREDLLNAIALNSTMFNGARLAGPAVAGLLVAKIGEGWCFFLNGVSYIAVIAGLLMMRIEKSLVVHDGTSPIEKLREGLRFVRHTLPIRTLLLLLGVVSFTALPFSVLMPIFADRILHRGASGYGWLMGAVGFGAMCGAFTLAMRQQLRGFGNIVAYSAIGLGVSLMLFGASRWYWFSLVALALAGYAMMMQFTSANTLIQAMVPDQLRGRVMSLYSMMFLGMSPLGSLVAGKMAQHIGAPSTVALGGLISLGGGVVFAVKWPSMRAPARELVAAQGMMQPQPPPEINSQ